MNVLKNIDSARGLALIDAVRRRALDADWFVRTTTAYPAAALSGFAGRRPAEIREIEGNVTDLIVVYTFDDGRRLVGKFLLPVVKTRPWLGFRGLDDRGRGIDERMILMNAATSPEGVFVPRPLFYDDGERVLWQQHIDGALVELRPAHWEFAMDPLGRALGRLHSMVLPDEKRAVVENSLFRSYLIAYPARYLEPFLDETGGTRCWSEFLRLEAESPRGLIHGDLKPGNIGVCRNALWLLDLERSNWANPAYDLGCLLCHLLIAAWDEMAEDAAAQARAASRPPGALSDQIGSSDRSEIAPESIAGACSCRSAGEGSARAAFASLLALWASYRSRREVDAAFERCVCGYLALFLAYRTATPDLLFLRHGRIVQSLLPALGAVFANWGCSVEALLGRLAASPPSERRGAPT